MKRTVLILAFATAFSTHFAQAADGNWMARVRAIHIDPYTHSSPLAGVDVDSQVVPELDFTYFISKNIAAELILGTARHEVTLNGASLGKVNHLPPTLTLQWHFSPDSKIRPYVGAGINYTCFYNVDLAGVDLDRNSFGGALQAGVDIAVTDHGYINLDVKKVYISTKVKTTAGAYVTDVDINPVIIGVGYGWRF
ncbi:outer membrane protein [Sulfuriferula plumbiphila]|uniref:Outer membrane protein n=1 Tax=Sulfuriferula plumbiphila TaxID=171865 RepID=A0A512L9G2_9PROT|nr:OmpW family outer membrane protein [Sulfuriferula plumbiphila]BBP05007.1 outer membrane protein [Sulfuriferula plumbiphila]GEP30781.1 outer membrane protein [Sulfuriferula plumbiphila]